VLDKRLLEDQEYKQTLQLKELPSEDPDLNNRQKLLFNYKNKL